MGSFLSGMSSQETSQEVDEVESYPIASSETEKVHEGYARGLWILLGVTLVVVLFGAFVRASLSGDGCGTSWPFCNGEVLPIGAQAKTIIEFSHRATSGMLLLALAGMALWGRKLFPKGHGARKMAGWALVFTIVSAVIGAGLVLFAWVTDDKSLGRVITMPIHLVNNYLLVGALLVGAFAAKGGKMPTFKDQGPTGTAIKLAFAGMFVLGMTGAISAMGKTAFETELAGAASFMDRMTLHLGEGAHPILRGGILHPLIATTVGVMLVWICGLVVANRPSGLVKQWAQVTVWVYVLQFVFGVVNLLMSAPLWMQLGHLALAIGSWVSVVMLAIYALQPAEKERSLEGFGDFAGKPVNAPEEVATHEVEAEVDPDRTWKHVVKDYIALTKPRVISLLLFTTVVAMFIAPGTVTWGLAIAVIIGGYASAGAANAYNMVLERDLDIAMGRTSHRPTVGKRITNRNAVIFASVLMVGSFGLLWGAANLLSAFMALAGLLTYVFVYTLWLKRRTWQNIVIGGAAGAFPPLVGYAAVTGELSPLAWFLFALIFAWTPVHFWALAILIKDDYAKAGVPMLPVVKGDRVTVIQIALYAVITVLVCAVPLLQGEVGWVYLVGAGLLNLGLLVQSGKLLQDMSRPRAKALFKYSMVYLAAIFLVIMVDQMGGLTL